MRALYLIPARGGSKGIPHKNIKLLCGKPLINYSIDVARKFASDRDICISTDDKEIINIVEATGLKVPFVRPDYLSNDNATTSDVIVHALKWYEKRGVKYDVVVLLQPTSPLRKISDVKSCLELYDDSIDMVTTVKRSYVSAVLCEEDENGFLQMSFGKSGIRRQDSKVLYEYNGAVYVINAKSVIEKGMANFTKRKKVIMPDMNSMDIDTMYDWHIVESLLEKKIVEL